MYFDQLFPNATPGWVPESPKHQIFVENGYLQARGPSSCPTNSIKAIKICHNSALTSNGTPTQLDSHNANQA